MVPRWDVTGDDSYGTWSPGLIALGDVKQLQLMQRRKAQAIEKAINPPLVGPAVPAQSGRLEPSLAGSPSTTSATA